MSISLNIRAGAARRRMRVVTITLVLAVVAAGVALSIGDYALSPDRLWQTLTGSGTRIEQYVVFQVRAPRTAMALVTGAALGIAGALLQSYLGNPLASPDLLGISGGSGFAAVFTIQSSIPLLGQKDLPDAIVVRLNGAINAALADPAVRARLASAYIDPMPMTPAQLGEAMQREHVRLGKLIQKLGITADGA